jgi:hypothetical protein
MRKSGNNLLFLWMSFCIKANFSYKRCKVAADSDGADLAIKLLACRMSDISLKVISHATLDPITAFGISRDCIRDGSPRFDGL